jgi:hypothetical protein
MYVCMCVYIYTLVDERCEVASSLETRYACMYACMCVYAYLVTWSRNKRCEVA